MMQNENPLCVQLEVVGLGKQLNYQKLVDPPVQAPEPFTTEAGQPRLMCTPKVTNFQKTVDSHIDPPDCLKGKQPHPHDFDCKRPLHCSAPIPMKIVCVEKYNSLGPPLGRITRNQDYDLVGSKFIYRCTCGARNGLEIDCRRIACLNNPACKMTPPRCWPQYRPPPDKVRCIEGPIQLCYCSDDSKLK